MASSKSKGIIIGITCFVLVLLCAAGGFLFYYLNRPIVKINEAIEEEDIDTVVELFDKLSKEEEILEVQDKMYDYSKELKDGFVDEEIDFDEVEEKFDLLGEKILDGNSQFEKLVRAVNELNESRKAYEAGIEAFEKEDYEGAIEEFEKVIKKDDNFEDAKKKIEECKEFLKVDVTGTYRASIDISSLILQYMGQSNGSGFGIPVKVDFVFELIDDENGKAYLDVKNFDLLYDGIVKIASVYAKKMIAEQYGVPEDKLETYVKLLYGKSLDEAIKDEIPLDDIKEMIPLDPTPFNYTVDDNNIVKIVTGDPSENYEMSIVDKGLSLDRAQGPGVDGLLAAGLELPIVFEKEN
ncbi:MAG: hypothetical protein K6A38_07075 [Lachnospiraceae bacterium]|nr:hypothetical protein [Lachnospiraceae bacterium]